MIVVYTAGTSPPTALFVMDGLSVCLAPLCPVLSSATVGMQAVMVTPSSTVIVTGGPIDISTIGSGTLSVSGLATEVTANSAGEVFTVGLTGYTFDLGINNGVLMTDVKDPSNNIIACMSNAASII